MKTLSRHMPRPRQDGVPGLGWLFLATLAAGAVVFFIHYPYAVLPGALLLVVSVVAGRASLARVRQRVTGRETDICAFSRWFDRREIDPWLIRAVWQEVTDHMKGMQNPFPLKPTDRIGADLEIDLEDMEDIVIRVAERAGYSLSGYKENPRYTTLKTIGDVVLFLNQQPKETDAEQCDTPNPHSPSAQRAGGR